MPKTLRKEPEFEAPEIVGSGRRSSLFIFPGLSTFSGISFFWIGIGRFLVEGSWKTAEIQAGLQATPKSQQGSWFGLLGPTRAQVSFLGEIDQT